MSLTASKVTPVMFKVKGQMIPPRLTLHERIVFAQGLGLPQKSAEVIGMQDRAASLVAKLMALIEQADDSYLQDQAASLLDQWNSECESYLLSH